MVGPSAHESGGGGHLALADGWLGRRPPGPMPQLQGGVTHGLEVSRFPDSWPLWGGRAYSPRPPWHVLGGPWVWSFGLFSSIFFSTSINKKKKLIKKEYCRCGPHPPQVISSRARPYLLRERATLAAFSRISGVGHSGS